MGIYNLINEDKERGKKRLAVLLDPEKTTTEQLPYIAKQLTNGHIQYVFVGGSGYKQHIDEFIITLKKLTTAYIIIFPGHISQFSTAADALLFLSLLTSKNVDILVGQHIKMAKEIKQSGIETIPMGYILIDGGFISTIEKVTHTHPIADTNEIISTAVAAELLGKKLVYLEAGSGAKTPVKTEIISQVRLQIACPLIVGGGIKTTEEMKNAFSAGADIVVIGNYFEQHPNDISLFGKVADSL